MGQIEDITISLAVSVDLLGKINRQLQDILVVLTTTPVLQRPLTTPPQSTTFQWPEHTAGMDFSASTVLLDKNAGNPVLAAEIVTEILTKWPNEWAKMREVL